MFGKINDNGIFASDCDGNVGGSRVLENGTHGGIAKFYVLHLNFFFTYFMLFMTLIFKMNITYIEIREDISLGTVKLIAESVDTQPFWATPSLI